MVVADVVAVMIALARRLVMSSPSDRVRPRVPEGEGSLAAPPPMLSVLAHMRTVRHLSEGELEQLLWAVSREREQLDLRARAVRCVLKERRGPDRHGAAYLELRETSRGARHFLGGRVVRPGDPLECGYPNGHTAVGQYDWSGDLDSVPLLLRDGGGFVALHPELDVRLRFISFSL